MHAPTLSPAELTSDASLTSVYRWLLIFGFSANEAAASLAPELFTHEPPASDRR